MIDLLYNYSYGKKRFGLYFNTDTYEVLADQIGTTKVVICQTLF